MSSIHVLKRAFNFKGELFSSTFTYALTSVIKLASSLVLTRLLNPEAYGVVAILFSVAFILEMVSDVGTVALMIRHPRGGEERFIQTLWTLRLLRSVLNFGLLYAFAPLIAELYETPILVDALRLYSYTFLLAGLNSMSFVIAQRRQQYSVINYVELVSQLIMTVVVIGLATVLKDHYAFIYGILFQRLLLTIVSFFFHREVRVGLAFDRQALVDQFGFAKVVVTSSILTILLTQYDKVALLKMFDLALLGVYGVAGSMIGPVGGLIGKNCRVVLYSRCAEYFRFDRSGARERYYRDNAKLLLIGTLLPAAVAGLAPALVALLYDARYAGAGTMLLVMGLGTVISSFDSPSEQFLVASGRTYVGLLANVIRVIVLPASTLLGYYLFGFQGFLWATLATPLAVMLYLGWEQRREGLLDLRAESVRLAQGLAVFVVCLLMSQLLLHFISPGLLTQFIKRS